jgi:hypothetical protein
MFKIYQVYNYMKNLVCNHCGREVKAENMAVVDPDLSKLIVKAENALLDREMTKRELAEYLGASSVWTQRICSRLSIVETKKIRGVPYIRCVLK